MGKQSKRKNKHRKGGGGDDRGGGTSTGSRLTHGPSPTASTLPPAAAGAASSSSSSSSNNGPAAKIILKIRHGDPRVRHASLVALSRTLYDAASLENAASKKRDVLRTNTVTIFGGNNKNKKNMPKATSAGPSSSSSSSSSGTTTVEACNPTLLRALSERILDVDIPCATIAVGCLSNYISFYYGCDGGNDDDGHVQKKKWDSDNIGRGLDEGYDDEHVVASDVMVPILLQRIQTTSVALQSMIPTTDMTQKDITDNGDNNSIINGTTTDKIKLKIQEQWTLLSLTLDALAGLIENCPPALQRLSGVRSSSSSSGGTNIIAQLFNVLNLICTPALVPIMDTATNSLRALHSLLDDNPSLISSIISTSPTMDQTSLHNITSQLEILIRDDTLPIMARLHACGSLLALRSVYLQQRLAWDDGQHPSPSSLPLTEQQQHHLESALERVQKSTKEFVLPYLYSFFDKYHAMQDDHFVLIDKMMSLSKQLSDMKNDENVELQVVSVVKARAEPARLIARRQKETKLNMTNGSTTMEDEEERGREGQEVLAKKEENPMSPEQINGKIVDIDAEMVVDDDENISIDQQQHQQQQAEDDLRDELDKVLSEWKAIVGSQKLALELVTNLTSSREADVDEDEDNDEDDDDDGGMMYGADDDGDDEHMWDSDDEAKLLSSSANTARKQDGGAMTTPNTNIAAYDYAIYNSMMDQQHNLPMTLLQYFRYWVEFLPKAARIAAPGIDAAVADAGDKEVSKQAARLPKTVSHDVDDILSTCALCLCNVAAFYLEGFVGENEGKNSSELFMRQLVSMLDDSTPSSTSIATTGIVACTTNERGDNNQRINSGCRHQQHVTTVLLSMLQRNQPPSHLLVDTPTLDKFISILLSAATVNDYDDYDDRIEATLQSHRNIIAILGLLCTNLELPLPEATDRKICRALLSRMACAISPWDDANSSGNNNGQQPLIQGTSMRVMVDSCKIAHEILNVLMDMYGNDDCHERVFDEECVLDQLRKSLSWFKRSVKKLVAAAASSAPSNICNRWEKMKMEEVEEDACVWNETALNVTRFIKYKQDMVRR
jgi:hypothetical protein